MSVISNIEDFIEDTFMPVIQKFMNDEGQWLLTTAAQAVMAAELATEKDGLQKFAQAEGDILAAAAASQYTLLKADVAFAIELMLQKLVKVITPDTDLNA